MPQPQTPSMCEPCAMWNAFHAFYIDLLGNEFRRRYVFVDEHLVEESIEDALLAFQAYPESVKTAGGVLSHLRNQVRGRISNKLRQQSRRRKHERSVGVFETDKCQIRVGETARTDYLHIVDENLTQRLEALARVVSRLSVEETGEILMLAQHASWTEWARVLKVQNLSEREQRRAVSREKERLKQKLRRNLGCVGPIPKKVPLETLGDRVPHA